MLTIWHWQIAAISISIADRSFSTNNRRIIPAVFFLFTGVPLLYDVHLETLLLL